MSIYLLDTVTSIILGLFEYRAFLYIYIIQALNFKVGWTEQSYRTRLRSLYPSGIKNCFVAETTLDITKCLPL